MIFSSVDFFAFFLVVVVLARVLRHREQNVMLLLASYFFYGCWNWRYIGLIFFQALIDAYAAQRIDANENAAVRRTWLLVSVGLNLGLLGLFKYFNFFMDTSGQLFHALGLSVSVPTLRLILPVGISFFTFQSMSYVIDVYRREQRAVPTYHHLMFVSFFPQLVAGPIERSRHLCPQLVNPRVMNAEGAYRGIALLLWGLFKKIVVADNLAPYVNAVYGNIHAHNGASALLATYLFTFQIYCDFSGYSDMAVGMGRVLGVEFMFNFRAPYLSQSVQEFWRRWHISLSTWFRDYLYFSLGGSFVKLPRELLNLMIVFVVSGLWHGASWAFVIWGALHGSYLVIWRLLGGKHPRAKGLAKWFNIAVTFHLVMIAWVFFRAGTLERALEVFRAFARPGTPFLSPTLPNGLIPLVFMMAVEIAKEPHHLDDWLLRLPGRVALPLALLVAFLIVLFSAQVGLTFIYFQFRTP